MIKKVSGIFVLLAVWQLAASNLRSPMFPGVIDVIIPFYDLFASGEILPHIQESVKNIMSGFSLAVFVGLALGILMTQSNTAMIIITPVVDAVRPIAALTLFPLIILILGIGSASKIFIIFWTSWPAILLNTIHAIQSVDNSIKEAAAIDGAGKFSMLTKILLPLSLSGIITGFRIGLSGGWISLISSEMLGANRGLGYSILAYSQTFRFPQMYAVILLISAIGLSMNLLLFQLQQFTEESDEKSNFIRFNDRASGFSLDRVWSGK